MADKDTLWAYVKTTYDAAGLVTLTNRSVRSATAVDDVVGLAQSQSVLNLWPAYAQVAFDAADPLHLEVAVEGVIAMLWRRGGAATSIEAVKWDTVFGEGGTIEKVRRTNPRSKRGPSSNSAVQTSREDSSGQKSYGWSDPRSLPQGTLPGSVSANWDS